MIRPSSPECARKLSAGEYGEASAKYFARYAVPLFYGTADESGRIIARNGSAFFVQTPKGVFGVTADHVIGGCLEASSVGDYACGLFPVNYSMRPAGLVEFDRVEDRIIDRSERRDIATFRITEDEIKRLGVSVASKWPPVSPEPGYGVGFCGFPSDPRARELLRLGPRDIVVSFMVFPVMAIASSVSEYQITYMFEPEEAVTTQGFVSSPADLDLGGMSGGPAFTKVETPSGIEHWAPAGVIYEGCMNPGIGKGRIFATRIDDCLAASGSISD
jgi:hypothetical protein